MGDERDMFAGLRWDKEIRNLADPHISFNSSPEFEFADGNRSSDDYDLTPFLQSTCHAPLHEECPQHHGHKGDPGVTPGTCDAIGERDQVILMWVRAPGV
jgi:hypothetical protein